MSQLCYIDFYVVKFEKDGYDSVDFESIQTRTVHLEINSTQFRLARDKHSSLLGPFVSNKDNVANMTLQLFSSKNKAQGPVL
jgi:hypothetical protein